MCPWRYSHMISCLRAAPQAPRLSSSSSASPSTPALVSCPSSRGADPVPFSSLTFCYTPPPAAAAAPPPAAAADRARAWHGIRHRRSHGRVRFGFGFIPSAPQETVYHDIAFSRKYLHAISGQHALKAPGSGRTRIRTARRNTHHRLHWRQLPPLLPLPPLLMPPRALAVAALFNVFAAVRLSGMPLRTPDTRFKRFWSVLAAI